MNDIFKSDELQYHESNFSTLRKLNRNKILYMEQSKGFDLSCIAIDLRKLVWTIRLPDSLCVLGVKVHSRKLSKKRRWTRHSGLGVRATVVHWQTGEGE